jgi:hypothetical protein
MPLETWHEMYVPETWPRDEIYVKPWHPSATEGMRAPSQAIPASS